MSSRKLSCRIEQIATWHPSLFLDAHIAAFVSVASRYSNIAASCLMSSSKRTRYPQVVKELMAAKSRVLSQAQSFAEMGMKEAARPIWSTAAAHEERLAPMLDSIGLPDEAAIHRVSAASCYLTIGEFARAANLYRAALAGPLAELAANEVESQLAECLTALRKEAGGAA